MFVVRLILAYSRTLSANASSKSYIILLETFNGIPGQLLDVLRVSQSFKVLLEIE